MARRIKHPVYGFTNTRDDPTHVNLQDQTVNPGILHLGWTDYGVHDIQEPEGVCFLASAEGGIIVKKVNFINFRNTKQGSIQSFNTWGHKHPFLGSPYPRRTVWPETWNTVRDEQGASWEQETVSSIYKIPYLTPTLREMLMKFRNDLTLIQKRRETL